MTTHASVFGNAQMDKLKTWKLWVKHETIVYKHQQISNYAEKKGTTLVLDIHLEICWENNGAIYWNILGYVIKNWKHGKISYTGSLESPQMGGDDPPKKPSTNWLPGGAPYSLAISSCVAGNSLEDVLNAPGTVYYVDAQGRLYLKRLGRPKRWGGDMFLEALTHNQMTHKIGTRYPQNTNLCGLSRHSSHSAHFGPDLPGFSTSRTGISRLLEWSNWPMGIDTLPARCNWVYPWHISVETSLHFFLRIFHISPNLRP